MKKNSNLVLDIRTRHEVACRVLEYSGGACDCGAEENADIVEGLLETLQKIARGDYRAPEQTAAYLKLEEAGLL